MSASKAPLLPRCVLALLVAGGSWLGAAVAVAAESLPQAVVEVEHGAIFPAERAGREAIVPGVDPNDIESYWTPTPEVVAELESRLPRFLEDRLQRTKADLEKVPWLERSRSALAREEKHVARILTHLPETRRQYIGIVVAGSRRVFVNCFPKESFPDWSRQFIFVLDGGDWFWGVQYEPKGKSFLSFAYNGEG